MALIRALRAMAPELPIIASSGVGEKAWLAKLKSMGVATVLHKPFSGDILLRALHNALHPTDETDDRRAAKFAPGEGLLK
jgi:DNA-binding response OmpR family regulator